MRASLQHEMQRKCHFQEKKLLHFRRRANETEDKARIQGRGKNIWSRLEGMTSTMRGPSELG